MGGVSQAVRAAGAKALRQVSLVFLCGEDEGGKVASAGSEWEPWRLGHLLLGATCCLLCLGVRTLHKYPRMRRAGGPGSGSPMAVRRGAEL